MKKLEAALINIFTQCDVPSEVISSANDAQETTNVTNRIFHWVLTILAVRSEDLLSIFTFYKTQLLEQTLPRITERESRYDNN